MALMFRVLAYWLYFAVIGVFLLLAALSGGSADVVEEKPFRTSTQFVGFLSGASVFISALLFYLAYFEEGTTDSVSLYFALSVSFTMIICPISWSMIHNDLKNRKKE